MRILYFTDNTSGHNQRFLSKLAASDYDVWFSDLSGGALPPNWIPKSVRSFPLAATLPRSTPPAAIAALLPAVERMLAEIKPDIVHAGPVQSSGYLIARANFHPMLLMSWGSDLLVDGERDESWREATRVALRGADAFFTDSSTVLHSARRFAEIPASRVVQFPWGVQRDRFGPSGASLSPEEFRRESGTFVLLCTRSWEARYGIDTLLQAFRSAAARNDRLRLVLVGGGSQEGYVRDFTRRNDLDGLVKTPGFVSGENMPKWFRAADGYVSCARSDGTSVSLLEAMASGLPIIVTDNTSNREWITPGLNGWVADTTGAFAEAMLRAADMSEQERTAMARVNRQVVSERADWDRNFPQLLDMYESLHEKAKPAW